MLSGLQYAFTIDDPGHEFSNTPGLASALQSAGQYLTSIFSGKGTILVEVHPDDSTAVADGGPAAYPPSSVGAGLIVEPPPALTEAQTGVDPLGTAPEIAIGLNPTYLHNVAWFDPSGAARTAPIPPARDDFITVINHEIFHGMGFTGFRTGAGAGYGTFASQFRSSFDQLTSLGAGGNPAVLYFVGARAEAAYGGPVPLTSLGAGGPAGQNFYHVGNPAGLPGSNLSTDLMSDVEGNPDGQRNYPSALDLAILGDLGWQFTAPPAPAPTTHPQVPGDYTGTGYTDQAIFLPSGADFSIATSTGGIFTQFGISGPGQTLPAPGDYFGTGKTDIAAYLPALGAFALRPPTGPDRIIPFGIPGPGQSIPAPGDYDGSGRTELAVYLPSRGAFADRPANGGPDRIIPFGIPGPGQSIPAPGDYDGDGKTDLAVYLPSQGIYAHRPSSGGADVLQRIGLVGTGATLPAPGNYDGTGRTNLAVYLPSTGAFIVRPFYGGPDQTLTFPGGGTLAGTFPVQDVAPQASGTVSARVFSFASGPTGAAILIPLPDLSSPTTNPVKKAAGAG
jgi:hypothetical protein